MAANDYAVVVGITNYPSLGDLVGPENDACLIKDWLVDPQGGCLPEENIALIISSLFFNPAESNPLKARPTTEQIDAAFDQLVEKGMDRGGRLGRRLYIFLAGHGFGPDIEDAALLMANAGKMRTGYHIPGRRYANWFRTAAMFEEIVLFMDTCRDDYRRAPVHLPPWPEVRSPAAAQVLYFYAFATRWSRKARERPIEDGGPVYGVFTTAILAALANSLPDARGRVTGENVANYIYNYLPRLMDHDEYQDPEFHFDKNRDFIFTERQSPSKTTLRISFTTPDPARSVEIIDSNFDVVASLPSITGDWDVPLKPGRYRVSILGTDIRKTIEILGTEVIHETL